jgi:hypothetical protein
VRGDDLRDDRQAEARAADVAAARVVETREPLEDARARVARDPRAVVLDAEDDLPVMTDDAPRAECTPRRERSE